MLESWDLRLWLCLSANWLCKGATCCILVFSSFGWFFSSFVSPCLLILWGLEKVSVRAACSVVCWSHGASCRWSEHVVVLAVTIKALHGCALKERRDGNWKTRKPENHFQRRDASGARSCCSVSLPALKPQATSEPRTLLPYPLVLNLRAQISLPLCQAALVELVKHSGFHLAVRSFPLGYPGPFSTSDTAVHFDWVVLFPLLSRHSERYRA